MKHRGRKSRRGGVKRECKEDVVNTAYCIDLKVTEAERGNVVMSKKQNKTIKIEKTDGLQNES